MQNRRINFVAAMVILGLALLLQGCETLSYYHQAATGQLALLAARQPVAELVAAPDTEPRLRTQLTKTQAILEFAKQQGLPVEQSYSEYVDLGRPYVVWNVFGAEPYSTRLKTHCFPIAGCVGYKGYFAQADAEAFAAQLRAEGLDVFVGGVTAYSTLGWFDDPLLNTFLFRSDDRLAAVLFHELAHKVLYVEGDTVFNESFATAVEHHLLEQWLIRQDQAEVYERYLQSESRQQQVIELILETRQALAEAYADVDADRDFQKTQIITAMKYRYQALKADWQEGNEFAAWMAQDLNNAHFGAIGAYHAQVAGLTALLKQSTLTEFFALARQLAALEKTERDRQIAAAEAATPALSPRPE